ncbi:AraC family transcriptional regulator [Paenibacillus montaniterrae]|uniref:AraC family transcriptional regulator n=1 Tax=Paenibacillus montaniterrae TaxID=429341 RepID=A0A919YTS6_9BACL|nr:AraC family transcriptional regulator [Paenibacillus montaniterrae]GIP18254.1 AraC family transcriptional regulator [Paenibacillus montaniterrae]
MQDFYLQWFTNDEQFPFFIQYGGHDEDMYLHKHYDFSELVIVLKGNAVHVVNSHSYFVKKGDVFVINGDTLHAYKDPHQFRICNIMYRPEMLTYAGSDLKSINGYQALFILGPHYRNIHHYESRLSLPIPNLEYVSSLIDIMIREYEGKPQAYQTMLASLFTEMVVYLSRQYDSQEVGMHSHIMRLANAISFMEDHYLEPISLEDIARHSDISVRHLNRIFRTYYQTTPISYLLHLRLEHACMLLKNTHLSITEVSYKSGFNDSNYFTRLFRKAYGISPKLFRNQKIECTGSQFPLKTLFL